MSLSARPYTPETHGDLEQYLKECDRQLIDNLFLGSDTYFLMRDRNLLLPGLTFIRVNRSPIPDTVYFVNNEFLLESNGPGPRKMSVMDADRGVYDPASVLSAQFWSAAGLHIGYD